MTDEALIEKLKKAKWPATPWDNENTKIAQPVWNDAIDEAIAIIRQHTTEQPDGAAERVARALCEHHGLDPDELVFGHARWHGWARQAECAIGAVRATGIDVRLKADTLIQEIEITLDYFRNEFPKNCETNKQHWADPIDVHAGGISADDLEEIKNLLQQREIPSNTPLPWKEYGGDEKRMLLGLCKKVDGTLGFPLMLEVTGSNHKTDAAFILEACNATCASRSGNMGNFLGKRYQH